MKRVLGLWALRNAMQRGVCNSIFGTNKVRAMRARTVLIENQPTFIINVNIRHATNNNYFEFVLQMHQFGYFYFDKQLKMSFVFSNCWSFGLGQRKSHTGNVQDVRQPKYFIKAEVRSHDSSTKFELRQIACSLIYGESEDRENVQSITNVNCAV